MSSQPETQHLSSEGNTKTQKTENQTSIIQNLQLLQSFSRSQNISMKFLNCFTICYNDYYLVFLPIFGCVITCVTSNQSREKNTAHLCIFCFCWQSDCNFAFRKHWKYCEWYKIDCRDSWGLSNERHQATWRKQQEANTTDIKSSKTRRLYGGFCYYPHLLWMLTERS